MELRNYSQDDLWLTEALESNPEVMRDLGGPTPKEKLIKAHERCLKSVEAGTAWLFVILSDETNRPAGTIGIWDSEVNGIPVLEICWMILPEYQGKGIATNAAKVLIERARSEKKGKVLHALTAVTNAASNAISRKLGFSLIGETDIAYNGPPCRNNNWKIEL